VFNLAPKNNK